MDRYRAELIHRVPKGERVLVQFPDLLAKVTTLSYS